LEIRHEAACALSLIEEVLAEALSTAKRTTPTNKGYSQLFMREKNSKYDYEWLMRCLAQNEA